jgi:hypothetical protein
MSLLFFRWVSDSQSGMWVFRRSILENMILESLSVPRDKGTGNAFVFSATFKELRVVDTEAAAVAVPQTVTTDVPQASTNVNQGKQAASTPSPSVIEDGASVLGDLTGLKL